MMFRRAAIVAAVAGAIVAAPVRAEGGGTIVVQLLADPAPAGVAWSYAGAGTTFRLGLGVTRQAIRSLADGSYTIVESSPDPSRPQTLTGITCSDPSGDSRGTLASASASVRLAAGETVTCVFSHSALGPKATADALSLAREFAPTLRLSAAEHYRPLAAQDYLAHAALKTGKAPRGATTQSRPTLFTLPVTPAPSYLDLRNAEPYVHASQYRVIEKQLEAARRPTVYWRLARQPATGRIAIEYWFLYLYNDFVDRHEADWEGVTVFVKDGAAIGVTYSQHQGRTWTAWPAAAPDNHPVVYVAAGSHANYPLPGRYRVKVCYTLGVRRCTTTSQRDNARGDGTTLTPDSYDLHELGGIGYTGSWSSGTYMLGVGLTRDRVVDPRRRSEYSNPFGSVPPGA
jgi:hypothetical protein